MSWQNAINLPHRARTGDVWQLVREARDNEDGGWTWESERGPIPIDIPDDFARAVERGVEVTIDYTHFDLVVWRAPDDRIRYRAKAQGTAGPERGDEELALWALLELLGDAAAPPACFFCRWSDVEPSTGWGNFGCFVEIATRYDAAVQEGGRQLKWVTSLGCGWVDPWHTCERFEVRPIGYGYRGRPRGA